MTPTPTHTYIYIYTPHSAYAASDFYLLLFYLFIFWLLQIDSCSAQNIPSQIIYTPQHKT